MPLKSILTLIAIALYSHISIAQVSLFKAIDEDGIYQISWTQKEEHQSYLEGPDGQSEDQNENVEIESRYKLILALKDISDPDPSIILDLDSIYIYRKDIEGERIADNESELIGLEIEGRLNTGNRLEFISFGGYVGNEKDREAKFYMNQMDMTLNYLDYQIDLAANEPLEKAMDIAEMTVDKEVVNTYTWEKAYVYMDTLPLPIDSPFLPFPLFLERTLTILKSENEELRIAGLMPIRESGDPNISLSTEGEIHSWYLSTEDIALDAGYYEELDIMLYIEGMPGKFNILTTKDIRLKIEKTE